LQAENQKLVNDLNNAHKLNAELQANGGGDSSKWEIEIRNYNVRIQEWQAKYDHLSLEFDRRDHELFVLR
jgi:hypothetical protein